MESQPIHETQHDRGRTLKDRVTRRKRNASFDLDLESGFAASRVFVGVDDDVIEWEALIAPLERDVIDGRARQAPGLGMGEHREQIMGAHLALEASASRTGRSWARSLQTLLANSIAAAGYQGLGSHQHTRRALPLLHKVPLCNRHESRCFCLG
jgi:hypothetical protein